MKMKRDSILFVAVILSFLLPAASHAANVWEVDGKGNITLNGSVFGVKGGSWFGLEGRSELPIHCQVRNSFL